MLILKTFVVNYVAQWDSSYTFDEWDAYRSAVRASKASNWEREQHENIVGSKSKPGESSTGIPSTMRKSQRMGIEPPSPYEIKNKYLEMEYKEMEAYANQPKRKMEDIWVHNNVRWMDRAHEIKPSVIEVINNALKITNFIYNHGWLLAQMRKYCGGDIVRPGATRLKLRNMEVENDRVAEKDYLDLLDISAEAALNSHQEIDSISAGHSSRPSAASTSASSYDGSRGGTDDGGDNGEGDIDERRHSQYPIS
ncbi:hypothetical protein CK203_091667 [Vitis vinifera]|uniref:Uncharacterized protein n=1 Tax=Vitis vinifera TaxID=29760 RepID=A0A438FBQ0_VITVI|nr:hypothetical protein CK203_091667 [Vitis vinifera]